MVLKFLRLHLDFRLSQMQKYQSSFETHPPNQLKMVHQPPTAALTLFWATIYVISGATQPLVLTLVKSAGLADPTGQLYMVFYYLGPASVIFWVLYDDRRRRINNLHSSWPPPWSSILKCAGVASFDLFATSLNYTGSSFAGPTIFSIIYSSVTVWTAVFSRCLLHRRMTPLQWLGVCIVFVGLAITALDASVGYGQDVVRGSAMVLLGSLMHALTYVMSEALMSRGEREEAEPPLSVYANCAIQGIVACGAMVIWQLVYTRPRWQELVVEPVHDAQTTVWGAFFLLSAFTMANFLHSIGFFFTLKHVPSGATSAGVMKGLQAVLVFVFTSWAYCGRVGGKEMCFSQMKLLSLVVVVGGVVLFGQATEYARKGYARIAEASMNGDVIEVV